MINGHGNNIYQYDKGQIKIDFSSNVAYNNKSQIIVDYLKNEFDCIKNYPDPNALYLTQMLAKQYNVQQGNILVTNGSAEAFYILAHWLNKQVLERSKASAPCKSLIFTPSFSEYEDSCSLFAHDLYFKNHNEFTSIDYSNFNSVWLCSPNNPNGYRVKYNDIESVSSSNSNTYFLIDRAYNELSSNREYEDNLPENLILIHSLTKSFGIPGLRLGFIIANEGIISEISGMRAPWTVNSLAIKAGEFIIKNYNSLILNQDELIIESLFLQDEISKLPMFDVIPSSCNFFLCKISQQTKYTVKDLSKYLIDKYGILIRNASNFRTLDEKYFRVAAQTRKENLQLIEALKNWN